MKTTCIQAGRYSVDTAFGEYKIIKTGSKWAVENSFRTVHYAPSLAKALAYLEQQDALIYDDEE